jgi:hypothetical protein
MSVNISVTDLQMEETVTDFWAVFGLIHDEKNVFLWYSKLAFIKKKMFLGKNQPNYLYLSLNYLLISF